MIVIKYLCGKWRRCIMFFIGNKVKKIIFGVMICLKCGKIFNNDENIIIKINIKELKGYIYLLSWVDV